MQLPVGLPFREDDMMATPSETTKKEKRARGSNWMPQALKVVLEMGILRREKIKGCEAVGDARDNAWKEISDNVCATGQIKTPQECFNKLRTYPSEVKLKYQGIAKETVLKSGAGGGTPVKDLQPSEIETLALSFLGIEKVSGIVGGRKTSLKPRQNFDYLAERKKERQAGAGYDDDDGDGDDDDGDVDSLLCGPTITKKGKGKTLPNTNSMNLLIDTMGRIEDRLIRVEGKVDEMYDEVKRDQKRPIDTDHTSPVTSDVEDMPVFGPPAKKKAPEVLGIPFREVKRAYEEFFRDATEDEWSDVITAVVLPRNEKKVIRERVYLKMLEFFSEDDIDDLQGYFIRTFPEFVKESISDKRNYQVLNAVGCELVSYGKFNLYLKDSDTQAAADECRILDKPPEPHDPQNGFGDAGLATDEKDKTSSTAASDENNSELKRKGATKIPVPQTDTPRRNTRSILPGPSTEKERSEGNETTPAVDNDEGQKKSTDAEIVNDAPPKKAKRGRPSRKNTKK